MNIAIVYSLPTRRAKNAGFITTDVDTAQSAREVEQALAQKGQHVRAVAIDEGSIGKIADVRADVIVNLIEWDGHDLPLTDRAMSVLEKTGIPFTGSSRDVVLLANDKRTMKQKLEDAGLPTPVWQLFTLGNESIPVGFTYPAIVKLALEHCSVGLSPMAVVRSEHELRSHVRRQVVEFDQPVIAEEFIAGREFQVTILERNGMATMLPPSEILFYGGGGPQFLTYESRWDESHPDYDASTVDVAKLTQTQLRTLDERSHKTFGAFGFGGYSRLDIRLRDDIFYILEANANPGLGDDEDYGMTVSYKAAGMRFSDFMWEIVQAALPRRPVPPRGEQAGLRK